MKLHSTLLAVALLLVASLAGAATSSTPTDVATAAMTAIFSAPTPSDCSDAKLPSFEPAPLDQQSMCGSCSDSLCQGKPHGTVCKNQNGKTYTCRHAYVTCVPRDCQCWYGALP